MKCPVCGRNFNGGACDMCNFPVVQFLGDPEEGLRGLEPEIKKHRAAFASKVKIGTVTYTYDIDDEKGDCGVKEEVLYYGTLKDLIGKTTWLKEDFDNVLNGEKSENTVCISIDGNTKPLPSIVTEVQFPGGFGKKLNLGIEVEENFVFCLKVKDENDQIIAYGKNRLFG